MEYVYWVLMALCAAIVGFGAYIVRRPATGGQVIANLGVGVCVMIFGVVCAALATAARAL